MLLIDKIIWAFLAIFFLSGWLRGFLKSLIGPFAFIFCFISAIIFYDLNRNILMTGVIIFAGTIALALTLSFLLSLGMATVNKEFRGKVFLLSRILGATINVLWQMNILFISILLISLLPLKEGKLQEIQQQIPESSMVQYYEEKIINKDMRLRAAVASIEAMRDPKERRQITQTDHFVAFESHSKVQTFLNDPEAITAFAEKDPIKLVQTKSLRDLVTDDGAMYLFTKFAVHIYNQKLDQLSVTAAPQPAR